MVSTHWREPREPAASELRALDVLARMAADLIERSRMDEALAENQQHLASIYNTVRDVIFELAVEPEEQFRFVSVNAAFLRVTGLSREVVIGKTVNQVIPEPSLTMVLGRYRQAIEEKATVMWEETSAYPTGCLTGEVSIAPVFDDKGVCTHLIGSVHDITERKRTETALRDSEERFRTVFEEGPLGVALVARDGRFLTVNNTLSQMLGYRKEELVSETFPDITHPDDLGPEMELIERLFRGEIPFYRRQKRYVKKTGEIIWVNLTASLLHDRESNSLQRLIMIEDVTEIRRSQEAAILRQKLESVGTLASGIAHDFNNLLGAVLAQAELAQAELAGGSSPDAQLKTICSTAMRGAQIVRELMIYAGRESKSPELVDVSEVIEQMLELLKISISKRATFEIDLSRSLPSIQAGTAQISQLVMNLATNASEALGDLDGTIHISTQRMEVERGSRQMQSLADGQYVQIEVSDTGCGIPPETQARIFDPFFSTKSAGRGLGLAVVHGIVQDLGGEIGVVSEPGHGTVFQILLPCAASRSDSKIGPISDTDRLAGQPQAAAILVVEDEDQVRRAVSRMLGTRGFSVIEARNGSDALNAIRDRSNTIDVLLLDLTIPGASARDVLQEARRLRPETKVVITSAYAQEMAVTLLQDTVEHFIRKPYQVSHLVQLIGAA
jgi:PAS domain S-box-containing protein